MTRPVECKINTLVSNESLIGASVNQTTYGGPLDGRSASPNDGSRMHTRMTLW